MSTRNSHQKNTTVLAISTPITLALIKNFWMSGGCRCLAGSGREGFDTPSPISPGQIEEFGNLIRHHRRILNGPPGGL
jgi:hypothetical protein